MAGKEAIVFLVDCNRSMASHMELTRKAIRVLMVQKMLQSKQHELGVVLFGLPEVETSNKLNDKDDGDYLGVKELCMLDKGSVDILRAVEGIDVPDAGNAEGKGDLLDAMVVGLHMIRSRTIKKKYARHVYLLTDAATPVEEASQLGDIVNMYADASMECKLHFVGLGVEAFPHPAVKQEAGAEGGAGETGEGGTSVVKEQNEKMLASVAAATSGTVVPAATLVDVMGESTIKTTNPVLSKVDLFMGTKLALHCRFFKKTDTGLKESLKKESIASYEAADGHGSGDGKVRVDKTYRDPEMPEVEVDFENQVKGYRYGQDYIPVNTVDEDSLKLPAEPPSIKILGFVPSSTIARHLYMDDTFVLLPEPGSKQALGAISSLTRAMRNLDQVAVVRFVRRKAAEPWLGILIPDTTDSATNHRFLFQKIPCSEDIRDYTFPSFSKGPSSRKPSEEQKSVSASLVDAMTVQGIGAGIGGFREGLVLDPVRQGVNGAKVARAINPDCELPELHPSVKAALSPDPELVKRATPVWEDYQEAFYFEKQERANAGKKRVTYFSDLTLAEPDTATAASAAAADRSKEPSSKKARPADGDGGAAGAAENKATQQKKVGSINPVSDFEAMMVSAGNGDQGAAERAELAVEQMRNMIHTFIRKGTTTSLQTKAVSCVKALRRACVSHSMGKTYNEFVRDLKEKYQRGDNSDVWEMVTKDQGTWPVTSDDDGSLSLTPQAAAEMMKVEKVKQEEEEAEADEEEDDDVDDMD